MIKPIFRHLKFNMKMNFVNQSWAGVKKKLQKIRGGGRGGLREAQKVFLKG